MLDYYGRYIGNTRTAIPLICLNDEYPLYTDIVIVDSEANINIVSWKNRKDKYGYHEICKDGVIIDDNKFILMSQDYLYEAIVHKDKLRCTRKHKLIGNYSLIFSSNDSTDNLILGNTYNYCQENKKFDCFRLATFNSKTGKCENELNIDVGKGIFFSHFSYQMIAVSKDFIAVAHPTKPEIYIYNHNLEKTGTITIDYPIIYDTGEKIDSLLPDKLLYENKFNTANIVRILSKSDILKLPRIVKIAFVNNDYLFIMVQPTNNNESNNNWREDKIHYIYSMSENKFLEPKGKISNFIEINSSQPLSFINDITIVISDSLENDKYKYYITACRISATDSIIKENNTIIKESIVQQNLLEELEDIPDLASEYNYVIFTDYSACSHCKFDDEYDSVAVVHIFYDSDRQDISMQTYYKSKYLQMFNNPTIFFRNEKFLENKDIEMNKIYKLK